MIKFALINIATGEVTNIVNLQSAHGYTDGGVRDGILFKKLEPGTNELNFQETQYWKDNQWNTREKRPGAFYVWKDYRWILDRSNFWQGVRHKRSILLSDSDWTQASDSPLSDTKKEEWRLYRQALRDITTNQSDIVDPETLTWPTTPS